MVRCVRCRMHSALCVCDLLPRLETRTRLIVVLHGSEDRKSTNTGRLAAACLTNSEVIVRGRPNAPQHPIRWSAGSRPLVLFPCDEAMPLEAVHDRPVTLIVPDGTWRQAAKVRHRVAELRAVPCVSLPPGPPSAYRLRSQAHDEDLATIEAVARAMGILEGPRAEEAIDRVFRAMVERTLRSRGTRP